VHSRLNATRVSAVVAPRSVDDAAAIVSGAAAIGLPMAIAGGRHAMGGQQFARDALLLETRGLDRVIAFDRHRGLLTVEGGIQWPALMAFLDREQRGSGTAWGIYQKQTGADRLTLAGALSCNAHGRGLTLPPIVGQVDAFDLIDPQGQVRRCSRTRHADLFRLAIGGYGLFGVIARVTLRLRPRVKVRRVVSIEDTAGIIDRFEARIGDGCLYGDFQFTIDDAAESFLRRGVFACYEPIAPDTPLTDAPVHFSAKDWRRLTWLAHRDKAQAFQCYAGRYLETSGQVYWSDAQLAASYVDDYHVALDRALGACVAGTEMITELYVPRPALAAFMEDARTLLRERRADVVYGTIRLIERDDETFLPWARDRFACVVFNLHVDHTPGAIAAAADAFRALIDAAVAHGGSYYLTYHRWARPDQVARCYPQLPAFLAEKRRRDPDGRFQSEWYRAIDVGGRHALA
jgi:FAD/FMN-containing dehydrogenase